MLVTVLLRLVVVKVFDEVDPGGGVSAGIGGRFSSPELGTCEEDFVALIVMSGGGVAVWDAVVKAIAAIVANPVAITMPAPASRTRLFGLASWSSSCSESIAYPVMTLQSGRSLPADPPIVEKTTNIQTVMAGFCR